MLSLTSFSQDTRTIKTSVLKAIKKDLDKCDSLGIAYEHKSILLDSTITNYFELFAKLEKERLQKQDLTQKLQIANDDLLRASKKPFGNITAFLTGGLIGMVTVLLIVLL